jgi:hypothetical protein
VQAVHDVSVSSIASLSTRVKHRLKESAR